MTLIDGDKIVTAQLYDDQHEEFTERKMSIIDFVNAYTDEGVTTADDVLDKIREEILDIRYGGGLPTALVCAYIKCLEIIDKYREERSDKE